LSIIEGFSQTKQKLIWYWIEFLLFLLCVLLYTVRQVAEFILTQKKIQKILDELSDDMQIDIDVFDIKAIIVAITSKERIGMSDAPLVEQRNSLGKNVSTFNGITITSGLDIRNFRDAVTFRIMMMLNKRC